MFEELSVGKGVGLSASCSIQNLFAFIIPQIIVKRNMFSFR